MSPLVYIFEKEMNNFPMLTKKKKKKIESLWGAYERLFILVTIIFFFFSKHRKIIRYFHALFTTLVTMCTNSKFLLHSSWCFGFNSTSQQLESKQIENKVLKPTHSSAIIIKTLCVDDVKFQSLLLRNPLFNWFDFFFEAVSFMSRKKQPTRASFISWFPAISFKKSIRTSPGNYLLIIFWFIYL